MNTNSVIPEDVIGWWAFCSTHNHEYYYWRKDNNSCPACESIRKLKGSYVSTN